MFLPTLALQAHHQLQNSKSAKAAIAKDRSGEMASYHIWEGIGEVIGGGVGDQANGHRLEASFSLN